MRSPYHPPQRPPGAITLERLLAAAEDQLREEEVDLFTIQKVLDRTGLSVGAFYSRFPDKSALLHAVQQRVHDRLEPKIISALAAEAELDQLLDDVVDHCLDILIDNMLAERKLLRAFWILSTFDPVMRRIAEQGNHIRRSAFLEAVLDRHSEEIGHPDPEEAMGMAYAMCTSVIQTRLLSSGPDSTLAFGVSDESIFKQLKLSLVSFLRGNGAN
ncbi:MAG: TetR/AcrR family transcriptional regulator [Armatimonadetes bacterium]|nr:TetR/AcrR family transcriptional regulator [Armatimonadota bacterium]